jgi:hypothetical protein
MNATAIGKKLKWILHKAVVFLVAFALLLVASATANAQQPNIEYGSESELAGVRSIFIYTSSDLKAQREIAKHILKKLPQVQVANSIAEADVVLAFLRDEDSYLSGVITNGRSSGSLSTYGNRGIYNGNSSSTSTPIYRSMTIGTGFVLKLKVTGEQEPRITARLLMDFSDTKKRKLFEREPYMNFARAFVKAYEKANKKNND